MFGVLESLAALWLSATVAAPAASETGPAATQEAPASAPSAPQTGPLSGYMEFHYNEPVGQNQPGVLDFHRFVLLFTHQFSDRIRFVGELELEHAVVEGLEEGGELELEQAYIDFLVRPSVNF